MTSLQATLLLLLEDWLYEVRVIRTKRVSARVRMKRKRYYRRRKARIRRMSRLRRRKPKAKRMAKRRARIRKRMHIRPGSRRRISMSADVLGNLMEAKVETKDLISGFENVANLVDQLNMDVRKQQQHSVFDEFSADLPPFNNGGDEQLTEDFQALLGIKSVLKKVKSMASIKTDAKAMIESIKSGKVDVEEATQILTFMTEGLDKEVEKFIIENKTVDESDGQQVKESDDDDDDEPMHTLYLKGGFDLPDSLFKTLETELEIEVSAAISPTVEDDHINLYTNDEAKVKKAIAMIGAEKIKEVAPALIEGNENESKTITEYEILDHGVTQSDYFQGAGVSHTKYDDIATGIGNSFKEALDDAAEQLAQQGYVISDELEAEINSASNEDVVGEDSDSYYFASIRVKSGVTENIIEDQKESKTIKLHDADFEFEIIDGTHIKLRLVGTDKWASALHFAQMNKEGIDQLQAMGLVSSSGRHFVIKDETEKNVTEDKKVIARWESKSKKHWVTLHQFDDGGFGYNSPGSGGTLGAKTKEEAVAEMQKKVDSGLFMPDANKTPMKKVEDIAEAETNEPEKHEPESTANTDNLPKDLADLFDKSKTEIMVQKRINDKAGAAVIKSSNLSYFSPSGKARLRQKITYDVYVFTNGTFDQNDLGRFHYTSKPEAIKYFKEIVQRLDSSKNPKETVESITEVKSGPEEILFTPGDIKLGGAGDSIMRDKIMIANLKHLAIDLKSEKAKEYRELVYALLDGDKEAEDKIWVFHAANEPESIHEADEPEMKVDTEVQGHGETTMRGENPMVIQYLVTALWSSTDTDGDEPLDKNYDPSNISSESLTKAEKDCNEFYAKAKTGLDKIGMNIEDLDIEDLGHNFWLSRNGHGANFLDGDYEDKTGKLLMAVAKEFKAIDPYVSDDGEVIIESKTSDPRANIRGKHMTPKNKASMGTSLPGKFVRSGDQDSAKKIIKYHENINEDSVETKAKNDKDLMDAAYKDLHKQFQSRRHEMVDDDKRAALHRELAVHSDAKGDHELAKGHLLSAEALDKGDYPTEAKGDHVDDKFKGETTDDYSITLDTGPYESQVLGRVSAATTVDAVHLFIAQNPQYLKDKAKIRASIVSSSRRSSVSEAEDKSEGTETDKLKLDKEFMGTRHPAKLHITPAETRQLDALYKKRDAMGVRNGSPEYNEIQKAINGILGVSEAMGSGPPQPGEQRGMTNIADVEVPIQRKKPITQTDKDEIRKKLPQKESLSVKVGDQIYGLNESRGEARVYVGTYAKYNEGSIEGKWLDLDDYKDKDEFLEACKELHKDEDDPEFMFQDYEGFPSQYYSESSISDKLWDYLELDDDDRDLLDVYSEVADADETDIESARDHFMGKGDSEEDWAQQFLDDTGGLSPENAANYLMVTDMDARLIGSDDADARVSDMSDEDIVEAAEVTEEYEDAKNDKAKEKIVDKARDDLLERYSDEVETAIKRDPIDYFVNETGIYTIEELAKASFVSIDYQAFIRDLEAEGYSFVRKDGEVWVFSS